jgi:hypothetical protein
MICPIPVVLHAHTSLQRVRGTRRPPLSYRARMSRLKIRSSVSLQRSSGTATRGIHLSRALSIELFQCRITLVLHNSSLLEVCDLFMKSARVQYIPKYISRHSIPA